MTFEEVARKLAKGEPAPDWVVADLRKRACLIGVDKLDDDDTVERLLFESVLHLQTWLQVYPRAAEIVGEDYPDCIDAIDGPLEELREFLATQIERPRRGPKRDRRRHLCAAVCLEIWQELHGAAKGHSTKLWEACEAYWIACGHAEYPSGHIKNWEDFLTTP